jgi:hypothetical protein
LAPFESEVRAAIQPEKKGGPVKPAEFFSCQAARSDCAYSRAVAVRFALQAFATGWQKQHMRRI